MDRIVDLAGSFRLGMPPDEALPLFTPEGERGWVPGWDPSYPAGHPVEPSPGTVFTTQSETTTTTWVVVRRTPRTMAYARVAAGRTAGLVTVTCEPTMKEAETEVHVRYQLTALTEAGTKDVRELEQDYASFLAGWQRAIRDAYRLPAC
jgi:hypothetical protein